ncbi:MAG TPA: DNA repair protein RadC [Anaerolineaceae bacterium]|nr:DNA repair protein RadC [Anaerolineaceae bacterium]
MNTRIYRIQDLDLNERPRERLAEYGPSALSEAELMAIILRVGVAGESAVMVGQRLLKSFGGLLGLHKASYEEVCQQHGLGKAKAAQIKAAIEIGNRLAKQGIAEDQKTSFHSPEEVASYVQYEMAALDQEQLRVILLDTRNRLQKVINLYTGSLNSSTVRIGELFKDAIRHNAASIILVHNHPSGDPSPSPEDINLTRAAVQAGKLLDIEVLDHIVIGRGDGRFVSLKKKELGF